jgi:hypothetical protein
MPPNKKKPDKDHSAINNIANYNAGKLDQSTVSPEQFKGMQNLSRAAWGSSMGRSVAKHNPKISNESSARDNLGYEKNDSSNPEELRAWSFESGPSRKTATKASFTSTSGTPAVTVKNPAAKPKANTSETPRKQHPTSFSTKESVPPTDVSDKSSSVNTPEVRKAKTTAKKRAAAGEFTKGGSGQPTSTGYKYVNQKVGDVAVRADKKPTGNTPGNPDAGRAAKLHRPAKVTASGDGSYHAPGHEPSSSDNEHHKAMKEYHSARRSPQASEPSPSGRSPDTGKTIPHPSVSSQQFSNSKASAKSSRSNHGNAFNDILGGKNVTSDPYKPKEAKSKPQHGNAFNDILSGKDVIGSGKKKAASVVGRAAKRFGSDVHSVAKGVAKAEVTGVKRIAARVKSNYRKAA